MKLVAMKMDCVAMENVSMTPEQLNSNTPTPTPTTQTNGNDSLASTLTIRMIMQGKEAGSIIGKKGDNVKRFREESGAKINISDASCPERIVTVTGTTDQNYQAFTMICKKFEEDILITHQNSSLPKPPVTIRLVVPASQCGSLIGKGGSKIKEIREITGASIQVASEMLPNSTERAVTVSGSADAITKCIYHICCVMIESPPKGATIPYRPKPALPPVLFAGGQPYAIQPGQQFTIQQHPADPRGQLVQFASPTVTMAQQQHLHAQQIPQLTKLSMQPGILGQPIPMMGAHAMLAGMTTTAHQMPVSHAYGIPGPGGVAFATSSYPHRPMNPQHGATAPQQQPHQPHQQAHEMTIPNDLIGCIIGRGGSKINEIRQLSGATIKIANVEDGSADRKVTITGSLESINAAQYLINASIEMHKQQLALDPNANPLVAVTSAVTMATSPNHQSLSHLSIPGVASTMCKPVPLLGIAGTASLGMFHPQSAMTTKIKGAPHLMSGQAAAAMYKKQQSGGNKYSPY